MGFLVALQTSVLGNVIVIQDYRKKEILKTIAKALKVNRRFIYKLRIKTSFGILLTFFELEQENKISIKYLDDGGNITLSFNNDEGIGQLFIECRNIKNEY